MLETYFRPALQPSFNRIAKIVAPYISANGVTIIAFITGIGSGICIATHHVYMAATLLGISALCDILDGTIARLTNRSTEVGAYIDLIADRMVEAAVILGFAVAMPEYALAYIIFFIAVLLHFSTFLAAGALFKNTGNKSMHHDTSLVERAEAFVIFFAMLALPEYAYHSLMCFNGLVFCSGIARFLRVVHSA